MSHLCLTIFSALPLLIWAVMGSRYRLERILTFTNPWEDSLGRGFQIVHSFFAFGSGGVWGAGIGDGKQKLFYLPEPHTDFIFSVLGEELGFVGVCVMIVLYFLLIYKAFRIARAAPDRFGYYLGLGLCFMMGFPILVHLGVVLGLMPTKGMALPFMSYGGSSLLINLIGVGILLNINSLSRRESKK
jgi:cell division protein FtsW